MNHKAGEIRENVEIGAGGDQESSERLGYQEGDAEPGQSQKMVSI